MAMLTPRQYQDMLDAKRRGDTATAERIMNGGTIIDVEVAEPETPVGLPDAEDIQDKLAAGMTKSEIGKEYGVSHQKIASILKTGGE